MAHATAKFRIVGVEHAAALVSSGGVTPTIVEVDMHFVNSVTWDPQTSEINFEGDNQQVRRTYLNGINVAIRLDTWDLAAASSIFDKDEVTTVEGVAGRTYFGDIDEQAGVTSGFVSQVRAENLTSGTNETVRSVSPKGRLQVIRPMAAVYNNKAVMELTYAAERSTTDVVGAALTDVPAQGAMWFLDRITAA